MTDALLTTQQNEESLSKAYAHAVAARAGYTTAVYEHDMDGVDIRIQAGCAMRPAIELQLKATINLGVPDNEGYFHFPLRRRNYDNLIIATQTPRYLVVLDLPREESEWMAISDQELILRRRAYWLDLLGEDETENQTSVTVRIPQFNVFDVDSLRDLMEQSRGGRIR